MPAIRVVNGALDVIEIEGVERFALRGVLDPLSLSGIFTPEYQREILADGKIEVLKKAIQTSRVPDIDLGMRGSSFEELGGGVFILRDDIYVIDGLQRKTAAERLASEGKVMPSLGAIIHLDTDESWERKRFEALNVGQTNLNTNVILRNFANDYPAAKLMLDLTKSPRFVLHDRVSWQQSMRRSDLLTAITLFKVVGRLHSHLGPGKSDPKSLARTGIPKILETVKPAVFDYNVRTFFAFINDSYGLTDIAYRQHATQLKATFLLALAGIVSDHEDFWDGNRLIIRNDLAQKLAKFPLNDQYIRGLASSAGNAIGMMEELIIRHINNGKRTRRLVRRDWLAPDEEDIEEVGGSTDE